MKVISGETNNFIEPILGVVTKKQKWFRKNYIYVSDQDNIKRFWGYSGFISRKFINRDIFSIKKPCVQNVKIEELNSLNEGDIVFLDKKGKVTVLWDADATDNCLLLTEECNCNCWMCPQPPKKDKNDVFEFNKRILSLLDPVKVRDLCLTGGEPTLFGDRFIEILRIIKNKFPDTNLAVLTNGKKFKDFEFTKTISKIGLKNLLFCISIHGDTSDLHDNVVRKKGSFKDTIRGLHNLAKFRQLVELRFVINKFNHKRLESFSNFVYRNFPFVVHIAFMAQEVSGFAKSNFERIWIDPYDYQHPLTSAVLYLHRRGLNVSIYNVPLCLLPKRAWPFARKSISKWKNDYLERCKICDVKTSCCGVFTTSYFQSNMIKPFMSH